MKYFMYAIAFTIVGLAAEVYVYAKKQLIRFDNWEQFK